LSFLYTQLVTKTLLNDIRDKVHVKVAGCLGQRANMQEKQHKKLNYETMTILNSPCHKGI